MVAIAARSRESAQKMATQFNIETVYEGYDNLANDKNIDVIYIGTVNSAHYELCMKDTLLNYTKIKIKIKDK